MSRTCTERASTATVRPTEAVPSTPSTCSTCLARSPLSPIQVEMLVPRTSPPLSTSKRSHLRARPSTRIRWKPTRSRRDVIRKDRVCASNLSVRTIRSVARRSKAVRASSSSSRSRPTRDLLRSSRQVRSKLSRKKRRRSHRPRRRRSRPTLTPMLPLGSPSSSSQLNSRLCTSRRQLLQRSRRLLAARDRPSGAASRLTRRQLSLSSRLEPRVLCLLRCLVSRLLILS